ncbi:MAG: response regulator [Lysobacterales bacterium]|nr:MAG: response regulator [Xanthomonadales bacterium]
MDPATTLPAASREPTRTASHRSLRERLDVLPLEQQFRVAAVAAVTAAIVIIQFVFAVWDTRSARSDALARAEAVAEAMSTRLSGAGGGALDDLSPHPEILAATFRLDSGEVLQRYVRGQTAGTAGISASGALNWTSKPTGAWHAVKRWLTVEPLYVDSRVKLPKLNGTVSVLVDPGWVWAHAGHRLAKLPIALLIAGAVAFLAAGFLGRRVVEPLAQFVESTRSKHGPGAATPQPPGNELQRLAGNFAALEGQLAEYERTMSTVRHAANQQVIERTREIEERLRHSEAMMRSKDDFLANMSHEIRTPMNGVLGMAELLAGTDLDRRQRRYVDSMRSAAETMMQIINDILDDSKIEAGKMELVLETFDVRELAEQAGQLYAGRAESKKLEMICRVEPTVPSVVVGDLLRLRQVIGNLLSNAVKYTEHGEIEIRIGVDDLRDGQCRLHFGVRDTGPGIPEADQSGVFQAFTQLGNGARTGGTGLGLSIATRLVKLMGGERIELASEPGRGSTFSFVLPFEVKAAAPVPNRTSDEFSGLRVLVVDDNPNSYMPIEETLSNWSAEVTVLNRAKPVGDRMRDVAARGRPFDVVVLDHSLPDATSDELLRTIRLDPAIADTYVVLLSALDYTTSYEGGRPIAPDVCIAKPVRQLLLRNALQASRQPRAPIAQAAQAVQREAAEVRSDAPALGLNVLVADDNAINREVAIAMLEDLRCRVTVAEDGSAAAEQARQERFDVIFMDCQMPVMDGYAATEAIRRSERERGVAPVTIVALTANVLSRDRERCLAAGMNAFLAKPFRASQLLEVLAPVVEARESAPVAPTAAPADAAAAAPAAETGTAELSSADVEAMFEAPPPTGATSTRLPVLDPEQVKAIRGLGKPRVFERLSELLVVSAKDNFARLDAAIAAGDLDEVAAAAHALKSPVASLGGRRLADLLERCETAAREGAELAAIRRVATGLKPHYAALVAALEAETRRDTGTG